MKINTILYYKQSKIVKIYNYKMHNKKANYKQLAV